MVATAPVTLVLECQTCGTRHTDTWPNLQRCPACAAKSPGQPARQAGGRYAALPGDTQTIISGHVTDAVIFEQAALTASERAAIMAPPVVTATSCRIPRSIDEYDPPLGPVRALELSHRLRALSQDLMRAVHHNEKTLAQAEIDQAARSRAA